MNITGCTFEGINELGAEFLESVYHRAMMVVLSGKGLCPQSVSDQRPVKGQCVGEAYADFLVEDKVFVELKAVQEWLPGDQTQAINC